jgi:hypothetical protein
METAIATRDNDTIDVFGSISGFESACRMAKALSSANIVPNEYRNNLPNCLVALQLAARTHSDPFMVMQNLHVIQGRPSWSATFIISAINASGRFKPLKFEISGEGEDHGCFAWTTDRDGDRIEGPRVTMRMAKDEGWSSRNGSKWKTMPDVMLRYRAASFFGRIYASDILLGMHSEDEVYDAEIVGESKTIIASSVPNDVSFLNGPAAETPQLQLADTGEKPTLRKEPEKPAPEKTRKQSTTDDEPDPFFAIPDNVPADAPGTTDTLTELREENARRASALGWTKEIKVARLKEHKFSKSSILLLDADESRKLSFVLDAEEAEKAPSQQAQVGSLKDAAFGGAPSLLSDEQGGV